MPAVGPVTRATGTASAFRPGSCNASRAVPDTSGVLSSTTPGAYDDRVSHSYSPQQGTALPPRRMAAVAGAAGVTLLAVGGALGFVPGAQAGASPHAQHAAADPAGGTGESSGADRSAAASDAGTSSSWLRFDENAATGSSNATTPPADHTDDSATGTADTAPPAVPTRSGTGQRVVYDIGDQRVWLVGSDGRVVRSYLVSGAKDESLLAPGSYHVTSKSRHAISFNHKETMNFMVRFAQGDHSAIGFHDIPAHKDGSLAQTRTELGIPTSAGCIRQWLPDAKALWRFTRVDSLVVVTA